MENPDVINDEQDKNNITVIALQEINGKNYYRCTTINKRTNHISNIAVKFSNTWGNRTSNSMPQIINSNSVLLLLIDYGSWKSDSGNQVEYIIATLVDDSD